MHIGEPDLTQLRLILNRHREASGMTFEQLAERSGLSRQTLLNISAGRNYGDLRTWLKLSSAFEQSLDAMLSDVWNDETR